MIPIAGSAYTYGYATLGELVAWIIGWDLILEYLFAASTVAVGWSGYVVSLLKDMGINIPAAYTSAPYTHTAVPDAGLERLADLHRGLEPEPRRRAQRPGHGDRRADHDPAGHRHPGVVALQQRHRGHQGVGGAGVHRLRRRLHQPRELGAVRPRRWSSPGHFGWSGIVRAAGVIFFAYIGFDAVSTAAQEAKNPQRDMPIGILGSLAHLHRALHRGVAGAHRHRELHRAQRAGPDRGRHQRRRPRPGLAPARSSRSAPSPACRRSSW